MEALPTGVEGLKPNNKQPGMNDALWHSPCHTAMRAPWVAQSRLLPLTPPPAFQQSVIPG